MVASIESLIPMPSAMVYSPLVVEHFSAPRNAGTLPADADVIAGSAGSVAQGVQFEFSARIAGERIREVRQRVYGCPHSIAAASWASEQLVGLTRQELEEWRWRELGETLAIPAEKRGRMLVLEDAIRALGKAWRENP